MVGNNIMECNNMGDLIFYKAQCSCMDDHDIHTLVLEHDKDINDIVMTLQAKVNYHEGWCHKVGIFTNLLWKLQTYNRRIKNVVKLLFTGYIEEEATFIFNSEEQLKDYLSALQDGLSKIQKEKLKK